jgi:hypothetical protein
MDFTPATPHTSPMAPSSPPSQKPEDTIEEEVNEVARELHLSLPGGNIELPIRLLALLTLVFGLSTLGAVIGNVFSPVSTSFFLYLLQIIIGAAFIAISYGLIIRRRWAVWLYSFIVLLGLIINPLFSVLPLTVVLYLYYRLDYFTPSILDEWAQMVVSRIRRFS